jgi:hypothetical protein
MKKWTVVLEISDDGVLDGGGNASFFDKKQLENVISDLLSFHGFGFQIMETIDAPYGPQHPNGVFLDTRHNTGRK